MSPNHYFLHKCSKCTCTLHWATPFGKPFGHTHMCASDPLGNTFDMNMCLKQGSIHSCNLPFDMNMCIKQGSIHSCNPMRGGGMHPRGPKFLCFFLGMVRGVGIFLFSLCSHQVLNIFSIVPRFIPYSVP